MPVKQEGVHGDGEVPVKDIHEPPAMEAHTIPEQFPMGQSSLNFLVGENLGIKIF